MNDSASDNRLDAIEIKLMHLEQQCEDMNSVILEQNEVIQRLKIELQRAEGKLQSLSQSQDDTALSSIERATLDKPPHY